MPSTVSNLLSPLKCSIAGRRSSAISEQFNTTFLYLLYNVKTSANKLKIISHQNTVKFIMTRKLMLNDPPSAFC